MSTPRPGAKVRGSATGRPVMAVLDLLGRRWTLRVLFALLRGGSFPLSKGGHCNWCPYDRACRRTHPPTVEREESAPDSTAFRLLSKKTRKSPMLPAWREPA